MRAVNPTMKISALSKYHANSEVECWITFFIDTIFYTAQNKQKCEGKLDFYV